MQSYIETLDSYEFIESSIILGTDGIILASSKNKTSLKQGEGLAIANLFKDPSQGFLNGVAINSEKYGITHFYGRRIYLKTNCSMKQLSIIKNNQTILICIFKEPNNENIKTVEDVADNLITVGF